MCWQYICPTPVTQSGYPVYEDVGHAFVHTGQPWFKAYVPSLKVQK